MDLCGSITRLYSIILYKFGLCLYIKKWGYDLTIYLMKDLQTITAILLALMAYIDLDFDGYKLHMGDEKSSTLWIAFTRVLHYT